MNPALGSSCPQDVGGPDIPVELERAAPIEVGTFAACIDERDAATGNGDAYVLHAPEAPIATLFRVSFTVPSHGPALHVTILDAAKEKIGFVTAKRGVNSTVWLNVAGKSDAYLKVWSAYDGPYSLTVEASDVGDTNEPNEDPAQATALVLGTPVQAFLASRVNSPDENDTYKLEVKKKGKLVAHLSGAPAKRKVVIAVFDAKKNKVGFFTSSSYGGDVEGTFDVKPGAYVVQVYGLGDQADPAGGGEVDSSLQRPYTLAVTSK